MGLFFVNLFSTVFSRRSFLKFLFCCLLFLLHRYSAAHLVTEIKMCEVCVSTPFILRLRAEAVQFLIADKPATSWYHVVQIFLCSQKTSQKCILSLHDLSWNLHASNVHHALVLFIQKGFQAIFHVRIFNFLQGNPNHHTIHFCSGLFKDCNYSA